MNIIWKIKTIGVEFNEYLMKCKEKITRREKNIMSKQRIAVTWEMCGYIEVEANSIEEAMEKVKVDSDDYPLPYDSTYVDGSFTLSTDDAELMKEMCKF